MPVLLALALDKPVVLLPQTYGPFRGKLAKNLAKIYLAESEAYLFRDHDGLQVVQELIGSDCRRAHFAHDMGFALDAIPPEPDLLKQIDEIKSSGPLVG